MAETKKEYEEKCLENMQPRTQIRDSRCPYCWKKDNAGGSIKTLTKFL